MRERERDREGEERKEKGTIFNIIYAIMHVYIFVRTHRVYVSYSISYNISDLTGIVTGNKHTVVVLYGHSLISYVPTTQLPSI